MDKPTKPTNLMPRSFGGVKNNFSASMQSTGFEDGVPVIYGGDNLNYQLDATGKELDYCEKICDYINSIGIGKVLQVNSNNQLDVTQVGVKVYNATESFFSNDIVVAIVSNEVKLYRSLIGNNVGNALTDTTKWGEVQLGSAIDGDNVTINLDSNDILHAFGVLDRKDNSTAIKTWTGTRAEYDAIVTKDANTIYNITDDTDVTLSLLELLYPVGSLYIASGNLSTCPLSVLGVGTWTLKTATTLVTGVNSTAPVVGNGMTLGLTNGTTGFGLSTSQVSSSSALNVSTTGTYGSPVNSSISGTRPTSGISLAVTSDPTKSGIEANITSTTLSVTIWERIS